jgi:hypothetical protein
MGAISGMSKKEMQNIISRGWDKRREKSKKKSEENSRMTKEWKARHPGETRREDEEAAV